jgi:UDP-N-acetylmuramoyl-L-alanyl-D-glutamate--2,6-diaminopimelate ligase
MVLEVTSHALEQYRFWGVKFDIAVITNITHEHLDYHKTFEKYRLAKAKLLRNVRWAILNKDDKNFKFLEHVAKRNGARVFEVSLREKADLNLKRFPLKLKIAGNYNLMNALQSSAVAQILGVDNQTIRKTMEQFNNLTGRMQEIKNSKGVKIYVDFAHTPNGLENALSALRTQRTNGGKLIAIIGAEGNRDPSKREPMGEIAAKLADQVIIAPVDPRGQLDRINAQIMLGVKRINAAKALIENDRQKAIEDALRMAKKGDIVGIFGKGHETSMNMDGKKEIPWSDKEAVERVLNISKQL